MSRVLWRDAQGVEGSLELGAGEFLIGRAMNCAIRTDDAMVSRNHARLFYEGGQYYVEDLGSANGVFYQESRVSRHTLRHGDAVRCGSLWLRFIDDGPGAQAPQHPVPAPQQSPPPAQPQEPARYPAHASPILPAMQPIALRTLPQDIPGSADPGRPSPMPSGDSETVSRLHRRVEQLQAELRIYRGGGKGAIQLEQVENEIARLGEENDQLKARIRDLEAQIASEGGDIKVQRAGAIAQTAAQVVEGLNDVLSNLRINVMAAEGEFDQYAQAIPRASFELIREALRSSAIDMETAREMLRQLRDLAS